MADRQRSFADMFSDLTGSLTQGAQWKRAMKPSTEKERARLLPQETREWLRGQQRKQWLDTEGDKYRFDPKTGKMISRKEFEMMRPSEFPIKEVADYLMMLDPRRSMMKGFQKFILPKLSKMTRRRQKRQMKDRSETRRSADYGFEESLREGEQQPSREQYEAHEQVLDRMGYNPTDKPITGRKYPTREVGEHRSPLDHTQDLAERFLIYLREKDARDIQTIRETRPDPDRDMANLPDYLRWVGEQGEEEARRRETGLPPIRRRDPERFEQVDKAVQKRYEALNDAVISTMSDKWRKEVNPDPHRKPSPSDRDILARTFGRRLSRDLP